MSGLDFLFSPPDYRSIIDLALLFTLLGSSAILGCRVTERWWRIALPLLVWGSWFSRLAASGAAILVLYGWLRFIRTNPNNYTPPATAAGGSRAAPSRWRPAIIILTLLMTGLFVNSLLDDGGDAWWWLNEGRAYRDHGVGTHEWFSYTAGDVNAPPQEWLSAIIFFLLHQATGWTGIRLAAILCYLVPAGLIIARSAKRPGQAASTAGWVLLAYFLARDEFFIRAEMAALPLFAMAWWVAGRWQQGRLSGMRYAVYLFFISLLWANCHFSFFLIFIFPASQIVEHLLARRPAWRSPAAALVAAAAAPCCHPLGFGIYGALAAMLATRGIGMLDIFQPPDFSVSFFWPALLWCAAVTASWFLPQRDTGGRLSQAVFLLAFLYARRNIFFLVIATCYALAQVRFKKTERTIPAIAIVSFILYAGCSSILPHHTLGTDDSDAAIDYLVANHAQGPILNYYVYGGSLGWHSYPARLTFIDGRNHLFERNGILADYLTVHFLRPGWQRVIAEHHIALVLWPLRLPTARALIKRGWAPIFTQDGVAVLQRPS